MSRPASGQPPATRPEAGGQVDFNFAFDPGEDQPADTLGRLRDAGPVLWSEAMSCWLVCSYEAVRAVLSDVTRFTSEGTPVSEIFGTEGMLVNDTPMHHTIRAVWAKHVGVAAISARLDEFTSYAAQALREVRPRIEAGETVDLVPVFREYVLEVIASTFAVRRSRKNVFVQWSEASADTPVLEMAEGSPEHQRHFAARQAVFELIAEEVALRKERFAAGEQPEDLIALMVAAEGQGGITSSIVTDNLFNFMLGALDTSEKWFANIMCRLYRDPELMTRIKADRSMIEALDDEVMRLDTVAQTIQRRVRQDSAELAGQTMKAGDAIMVMLGAANRDATVFSDPDRFDIDRPVRSNLGFGFGFHHCLGINLAKQEAIALVNAMLDEMPDLTIVDADYGDSWALYGPRALWVAKSGNG